MISLSAEALKEMICALLFGPLVNTLLNLVLIGPVIERPVALPKELGSHAAGFVATAAGGGYSNYIAVSNTVIHRKCGGKDTLSCLAAAGVAATFLAVHPLFEVVGYVPTLVVAAICVYIGADFLWDNLVEPGVTASAMASWAVLALCLAKDMLWGVLVGVAAFQRTAASSSTEARCGQGQEGVSSRTCCSICAWRLTHSDLNQCARGAQLVAARLSLGDKRGRVHTSVVSNRRACAVP